MNLKTVPYIIIILLMLVIFFQRECHRCADANYPKSDTVFVYDSIPYTPPSMTPNAGIVIEQPIPAGIDSLAVARAYYAQRIGIDTLVNDSLYLLSLSWQVQENKPTFYQPTIVNRRPTVVISNTIIEPARNKYFIGFGVGRSPEQFGLAGSVALVTKKDNLYTMSYDVINKDFYVTFYYKIKLRKK